MAESPVCPETGAPMRRDARPMTLNYKGQSITFDPRTFAASARSWA